MPAMPLAAAALVAGVSISALLGGAWWATVLLATAAAFAAWLRGTPGAGGGAAVLVLVAAVAVAGAGHARFAEADSRPPPPRRWRRLMGRTKWWGSLAPTRG